MICSDEGEDELANFSFAVEKKTNSSVCDDAEAFAPLVGGFVSSLFRLSGLNFGDSI